MENFEFQLPVKILFGRKTEDAAGREAAAYSRKVLLHYGGGSIKRSGLYARVTESLAQAGIEVHELAGVVPNPRLSLVRTGIKLCRERNIGFLLAVGGGSVIDSAKAIAAGAVNDADVWDEYFIKQAPVTKALPIGTVLTIPAAGSEASMHTVISDDQNNRKLPAHGAVLLPKFSILNPELTTTLPAFQTAAGVVDMMAHIMERYFSAVPHLDFTRSLCEGALRSIMRNAVNVLADPGNYDYRSELMLAGMVAHNDTLGLGSDGGDWMSHLIEHELSAIWDITHGEGLATIFPAWMSYVYKSNTSLFVRFAEEVFGIRSGSDTEKVIAGIDSLKKFFHRIGMRTSLKELGVDSERIPHMAAMCVPEGKLGSYMKIGKDDIEAIYRLAL